MASASSGRPCRLYRCAATRSRSSAPPPSARILRRVGHESGMPTWQRAAGLAWKTATGQAVDVAAAGCSASRGGEGCDCTRRTMQMSTRVRTPPVRLLGARVTLSIQREDFRHPSNDLGHARRTELALWVSTQGALTQRTLPASWCTSLTTACQRTATAAHGCASDLHLLSVASVKACRLYRCGGHVWTMSSSARWWTGASSSAVRTCKWRVFTAQLLVYDQTVTSAAKAIARTQQCRCARALGEAKFN